MFLDSFNSAGRKQSDKYACLFVYFRSHGIFSFHISFSNEHLPFHNVLDHIVFVDTSNARQTFDLIIRGRFLVKNFITAKFYGNYPEAIENIFTTL